MSIDLKDIGLRLRRIRESRGYTQEEIAGVLDIPRPSVVQIEAGKRSLDSIELMKLSAELGFDPKDLFAAKTSEQLDSVTALFRADPDLATDKKLTHTISKWSALCRQFTTLERLVGVDRSYVSPVRYDLPEARSKWEAIQQGTIVADHERSRLKLGTGPVSELPEIIEAQGVRGGVLPLDDSISGLFMADEKFGLSVLINANQSEHRQLFSYAHEYSHLLFDREKRGTISRLADREELTEVRANAFAAAFLMPEQGVKDLLTSVGKTRDLPALQEVYDEDGSMVRAQRRGPSFPTGLQFYDVAHLAFYFGVSYEAALWRLKALQILSEEERNELFEKQGSANAFRRVLGERFANHRQRFVRRERAFQHKLFTLALEAFRLGHISRAKLKEIAEDVEVPNEELKNLLGGIDVHAESEAEGVRLPN
ncbi:MAG: XRE family transcriptional regulator [Acidobacteriia bacterium]|nr:XRE family transcriptional regulator [Terriglobia bacterium]